MIYKALIQISPIAAIALLGSLVFPAKKIETSSNHSVQAASTQSHPQPIYMGVSLIWEGDHLQNFNIQSIARYRKEFQGQNLIHFLSPAYFLKQDHSTAQAIAKIQSVVRPQDSIGLYLQPWKSIVKKAELIFRKGPTYWGNTLKDCHRDCGKEVPLSAYTDSEITKMVIVGKKLLQEHGFPNPKLFLAGGWLASQGVLNSIASNKIYYDFSAIPPALLKRRLSHFPLYSWINQRWKYVSVFTQPHILQTGTTNITEIGFSGGIIDFVTHEEMFTLFKQYAKLQKTNPKRALVFNIGFHQETADQFLPRLKRALQNIYAYSQKNGIIIKPLSLPRQKIATNH